MKRTVTVTFIVGFLFSAHIGMAQGINITLDADSADAKLVFSKIQDLTGLTLKILKGSLDGARKVTVHVKNNDYHQVLEDICKNQPFYFYILEQSIVVARRTSAESTITGKKIFSTWGRFVNEWGEGVENVCVYNLENVLQAKSYSMGKFYLKNFRPDRLLKFWSKEVDTGFFILPAYRGFKVTIQYRAKAAYLPPVEVIHTEIQQVTEKRKIGSVNKKPPPDRFFL